VSVCQIHRFLNVPKSYKEAAIRVRLINNDIKVCVSFSQYWYPKTYRVTKALGTSVVVVIIGRVMASLVKKIAQYFKIRNQLRNTESPFYFNLNSVKNQKKTLLY